MLEELCVQNFILIEKEEIPFKKGLNVLTGETGAGKSILVGALSLLLGAKSEQGYIRTGQEEAVLSAVLSPPDQEEAKTWMEENGLPEVDPLILRRHLRQNRRGACYIGALPVNRQQLEDFSGFLVDLHGQHEHQSLFQTEVHRRMLDQYLGLEEEVRAYGKEYLGLLEKRRVFEEFCAQEAHKDEEIFRLRQTIQDLTKAKLQDGEEEDLTARKNRMNQSEKLHGALASLETSLWEGRSSALGLLKTSVTTLQGAAQKDPELEPLAKRLDSLFLEVEDVAASLHAYQRSLDFNPDELAQVEDRLSLIYTLEKKYGPTVKDLLAVMETSTTRLSLLEGGEDTKQALLLAMKDQEKKVYTAAAQISQKRKAGAPRLSGEILTALKDLGMGKSQFLVQISPRTGTENHAVVSPSGLDVVEFLISPNPGEPLKPLKDIASGGEISRVMLALKSVLSEADNIPILVFDEIDTGIGGEIGMALGRYLKKTALKKQVICITHLASIASFADHHLKIEKQEVSGRTVTRVFPVAGEPRVQELARMLSGSVSDASLHHAQELLERNKADREV